MPACPQCNKPLRELVRKCPTCQADLDLLVDYVSHLAGGLQRADNLARAGELGEAVWAYLEVLETDPDNATARKQVGRVVTAVRKFDLSTPARRVALGMPPREATGIWKHLPAYDSMLAGAVLVLIGVVVGLLIGIALPRGEPVDSGLPAEPPKLNRDEAGPPTD